MPGPEYKPPLPPPSSRVDEGSEFDALKAQKERLAAASDAPKPPCPLPSTPPAAVGTDRMLKWFAYKHLPAQLQEHSKPFGELAEKLCAELEPGPERTVALRKLLEAKDAAVRAALSPGG